ncbi:MAG: type II secretion system protein GspD, partial [Myxococcales bacterium]|nr:type II secretion system protein GspD [Myxococcales bacterium]
MKPQHALTLLSAAATFMVLGLTLGGAGAQEPEPSEERPTVQVRPGTGATTVRTPRLGDARRPVPTPAGGDEPSGPRAPGTGSLPQFETGVDYEPVSPRTRVTFNLEDADLPDLVRLISNLTGKRFIVPQKIRSIKATVLAPTKVSVSEAYNAFLSILEVNGLTIVPAGRYLKIAESANIENQPIPLYTGGSPTPNQDRYLTRLHRVENVSAEDLAQLLTRFKSAAGAVTAYAPTNTLIITDTGTQIQRMLRLIESIDVARTGEQIWIEPIFHANATEVAAKLQEIFPSAQ